jgi:amino acid transporter
MIRDCILVYHIDSPAANSQWFPTLSAIISLVLGGLFNGRLAKAFPMLEGIMLVIHMASWAAFVVTLWVTSPRGHSKEILFTFNNGGGWSSPGAATLIGVLTACSALIGYDSAVHMSACAILTVTVSNANNIFSGECQRRFLHGALGPHHLVRLQ